MGGHFLVFLGVAAVLIVVPGPDMALVTKNAVIHGRVLLLGGAFVLVTLAWLSAFALVAARASTILRRPRVKAMLDRLTGAVLVGLGIRLATERR